MSFPASRRRTTAIRSTTSSAVRLVDAGLFEARLQIGWPEPGAQGDDQLERAA